MNRRDFLLLRTEPQHRECELSGERLYMRCLDIQMTAAQPETSADPPAETSPGDGEPPPVFAERSREQLFEDLDRDLHGVEVLRVVKSQWLVGDLREDFDRLLAGFRARGGRIQIES
jgi:hypothetical protein